MTNRRFRLEMPSGTAPRIILAAGVVIGGVVLANLVFILLALYTPLPPVTIRNESSCTLSNVVLSGSETREELPAIRPGGKAKRRIREGGFLRLTVDFDADGQHYQRPEAIYVENLGGHYFAVAVAVTKDFQIEDRWFNQYRVPLP